MAALVPAQARAQGGLYLTWSDCAQSGNSLSNFVSDCGSTDGNEELYCAFTMPQATGADVLGVIAVIDLQDSASPLPAWWHLEASGGCRSQCATGACLTASTDFSLVDGCVDPWHSQAVSEVQGYSIGEPRGAASQVRIKAVTGVTVEHAVSLDGTSMYYGVKLVIQNTWTSGAGVCTGCSAPACLVLNSIEVVRTAGAPGGNLIIQTPGAGNMNWARWRGSADTVCGAVPVRALTWGGVKRLYR